MTQKIRSIQDANPRVISKTRKAHKKNIKLYQVLCLLLGIWIVFMFGKGFFDHYRLRQRLAALNHEIQAFELRNEQIRQEIGLHSSHEYVERIAREELGLVMPGETRYIISQPDER